jgi:hypothetical protein
MDIEELKEHYVQLGGSQAEVENIDSIEEVVFLVNLQTSISELSEENEKSGQEQSDLEMISTLKADLNDLPHGSEPWRMHTNAIRNYENKIRKQLGLEAKQYEILDSDLHKLLALDSMEVAGTCKEYLSKIESMSDRKQLEMRLLELRNTFEMTQKHKEEKDSFDQFISTSWESLKIPPVRFIEVKGKLAKNPAFGEWEKKAKELEKKLTSRIKLMKQFSEEYDAKVDHREKVFRIKKQLDEVLQQQGVKGNG